MTAGRPRPSEFLAGWFRGCRADQFLNGRALRVGDGTPLQWFTPVRNVGAFLSRAFSLVENHHVYFGACPRDRKDGSKAAVSLAPGLWVDLDWKTFPGGEAEAREVLDAFRPAPTWVIRTGGGWHCYWQLREPVPADDAFEARLKRLAAVLRADPAAAEKARVLRVPASWNHKYADAQVEILSWPTP